MQKPSTKHRNKLVAEFCFYHNCQYIEQIHEYTCCMNPADEKHIFYPCIINKTLKSLDLNR